jgi:hypothetical protein
MTEAVPQQFVSDDGDVQVPQDNTVTDQEVESREGETGRRGRPRSQEAMNRDLAVLETLNDGAQLTRNEIAEKVGFTGVLTYLSLYRLQREGRVARVSDGTTRRAWRQTTPEDAQATDEQTGTNAAPAPAEG